MEIAMKNSILIPKWLRWPFKLSWYEWIGWIVEAGLLGTFGTMTVCEFFYNPGERAGWVMLLISFLFAGPGIWILLGYRPKKDKTFENIDMGVIICFAVWAILLGLLTLWTVHFYPGSFGTL